ncbi:hypothetical protein DIPPA_17143 [Diplonema papillatum]|nr:hypothetical protein DIPPA_17143 [Diplonema papillatum]
MEEKYVQPTTPIKLSEKFPMDKRSSVGGLMRRPNNAAWSKVSAPIWFYALASTYFIGCGLFYYNYETVPGAKGRDTVIRRTAGFVGTDGFMENIHVPGAQPIRPKLGS